MAVVVFAVVLGACDSTGPEDPVWTVSGRVTSAGEPIPNVRVHVGSLAGLFGSSMDGTATSGSDGRFQVQVFGSCGYGTIDAQHSRYLTTNVSGFDPEACPDALSNVHVFMEPYETLVVTTMSLPPAALGVPYEAQLEATGGDWTYQWSIVDGALPPGLELSGDYIEGVPTESGDWSFTVQVETTDQQMGERELSLEVVGGPIVTPHESCTAYPDSAMVTFEDVLLEKAVRRALGVPTHARLTCDLVSTLTTLDASDSVTVNSNLRTVESLAGLQNLTALRELDLGGNRYLVDVTPLAGLTDLSWLSLRNCSVSDVTPLSALTGLTFLDLTSNGFWPNELADVTPLSTLASVVELRIRNNAITNIEALGEMTRLERLDAAYNAIPDIGMLDGATGMRHLDLESNEVSDIGALSGMNELAFVNVNYNAINDLGALENKTSLVELYAANLGTVTSVAPLSGLTSLEHLDLQGSALDDVAALSGLPALQSIRIPYGRVPMLVLEDLPSLTMLDAEHSEVGTVSLLGMPSLVELRLDENQIRDVSGLSSLAALVHLRLYSNEIANVDPLSELRALSYLLLSANDITDISSLRSLTDLDYVWLNENRNLADIQPLLDNTGIGSGDVVDLSTTLVPCAAVASLRSKGVTVYSTCN